MALIPKFFRFPFGSTGDKTVVPDDVQPGGSVSYAEGWGYDYERNPATDPAAKRIPRNESNQLAFDTTSNIQQYQLYGVPWFYTQSDNGGTPIAYARGARVRYSDGGAENVYISLVDNNTKLPTDATAWLVETPLQFSTLGETIAAQVANKATAPATLAPAVQGGTWNYAVAGGTSNALTVTLNPAPTTIPRLIQIIFSATNTGAATLNVNGLGAAPIVRAGGGSLIAGDLLQGAAALLVYDGTQFQITTIPVPKSGSILFTSSGNFTVPAGINLVRATVVGGGGGGGNCQAYAGNYLSGGGGGGGGTAIGRYVVYPGQIIPITIGAGGASQAAGGTSSFGSFCSASGGAGSNWPTNQNGSGGPGGTGTGGQINLTGAWGSDGQQSTFVFAGNGGGSSLGGGGRAAPVQGMGGGSYGGGGGGTYDATASGVNKPGGSGAAGVVFIQW